MPSTSPRAFPCPSLICNPVGTIVGGLGGAAGSAVGSGIGAVIGAALTALVQVFTGSAKENLHTTIQAVRSTPVPNLKGRAFTGAYSTLFAPVILLVLVGVLASMIVRLLRRHRDESILTPGFTATKIVFAGAVLPGAVTLVIFLSEYVSKLWLAAFDKTKWQTNVEHFPSLTDAIGQLFLTIITWLQRLSLVIEILPLEFSIPFFTLLTLFVSIFFVINNDLGFIGRLTVAFLITCATLKLMLTIVLSLGGIAIAAAPQLTPTGQESSIVILLFIAQFVPAFALFMTYKRVKVFIENYRQRIDGEVSLKQNQSEAKQQADVQRGRNAQLAAFNKHSQVGKDVAAFGAGAAADHIAAAGAKKVATAVHPALGGVVMFAHHRYVRPKIQAAQERRAATQSPATGSRPNIPPPPPPQVPPAPSTQPRKEE